MMSFRYRLFVCIFMICFSSKVKCQETGDACRHTASGQNGVCTPIRSCPSALAELRQRIRPQTCSFVNNVPVVCCPQGGSAPPTTSTTTRATTTTAGRPALVFNDPNVCPDVPASALKVRKNGQKAWDKCIDLIDTVYVCVRSNPLFLYSDLYRSDTCAIRGIPLIVGGTPAAKGEFPHMALLGFGDDLNAATWECGGTLISEKWVMTAAHCLANRLNNDVKYVRLGAPGVDDPIDNKNLYTIIQAVPHPDYSARFSFNDIALLELDRAVSFKPHIRPACLHVGNPVNDTAPIASGWGITNSGSERSNILLKVTLEKYSYEVCKEKNPPSKKLKDGLRDATQVCAGHRTEIKDSCQGDSGGPLQIYNRDVSCTYIVIGIVSTGRACGVMDQPAIYTRVSAFVPWIESVVWP